MVENDLLELFVYFFLFTENDFSFSFDCRFLKLTVLKDVRNNADACTDIMFEAAGVIDGLFTGGVSI